MRRFTESSWVLEKDFWQKDASPVRRVLSPAPVSAKSPKRSKSDFRAYRAEIEASRVPAKPRTKDDLPELLTYKEACIKLRCGMTTLRELIHSGCIRVQPIRGKRFISVEEIARYQAWEIEQHEREG
jgi:excisionase family DNA binding protein